MPDEVPQLPAAVVEHCIPGRMRVRIWPRQGDAGYFHRIAGALSRMDSVRNVHVNAHTGGILIMYEGDQESVLDWARTQGLFDASPIPHPVSEPANLRSTPSLAALNIAAVGLTSAGILQLARGRILGSASENLWNAYGLFVATRQMWVPMLLTGFGVFQIARGDVLGSATSLFLYAFSAHRLAQHLKAEDTI